MKPHAHCLLRARIAHERLHDGDDTDDDTPATGDTPDRYDRAEWPHEAYRGFDR